MEDHTTTAPTDSNTVSIKTEHPVEAVVDPQPSTEPTPVVEVKPEPDLIHPAEQNLINNTQAIDNDTKIKVESADQTLDRDQELKNSTVIVENSEKNDDTSSTTSDDSDDESSTSMHLGLEQKKSKVHDLDEDEDPADNKPIRSVNELKELPPEEPVYESIDIHDQISLLGEVTHHVDEFIVIRSDGNTPTVDIDSVLCLEDRSVLGRVHETFGRVDNPLYSVRLTPLVTRVKETPPQETPVTETVNYVPIKTEQPSNEHVTAPEVPQTSDSVNGENNPVPDSNVNVSTSDSHEQSVNPAPTAVTDSTVTQDVTNNAANDTSSPANDVAPNAVTDTPVKKEKKASPLTHVKRPPPPTGTKVYYVSKFSKVLSSWREVYSKGYDASNEHDEEVPEEELEFSDDEKEAEAKRLAKSKRKKPQQSGEGAPSEEKKRPRKRAKHSAGEGAALTPVNPTPAPYTPQPPVPYYPMAYPAPWPQPYGAPYAPQFVAPMPGYGPNAVPYPTHINYYAPYPPNLHPPPAGRGRGNVNQSFVFTNPPNQNQQQ